MNKKTIDGIRKYYDIPKSITDRQIKTDLKDSYGAAIVNMNMAISNLKNALREAIPKVFKRYFTR